MSPNSHKIFILDDEQDMTLLTGTLLKVRGFDVVTSNDAEHAIDALAGVDYDIIIMDLMMPRVDGFSMLRQLRATARHAKTPVIIFSAKRMSDLERKTLIECKARFLAKPCVPTEFVRIVRRTLTGEIEKTEQTPPSSAA